MSPTGRPVPQPPPHAKLRIRERRAGAGPAPAGWGRRGSCSHPRAVCAGQGTLFPGLDDEDDDAEVIDTQAEIVGVDSARAARRGHKYPKPKYAGGATGAVLGEVFGDGPEAA